MEQTKGVRIMEDSMKRPRQEQKDIQFHTPSTNLEAIYCQKNY